MAAFMLPAALLSAAIGSDPNTAAEPNARVFQSWPPPGVSERPKPKPKVETDESKLASTLSAMSFWRLGQRIYQAPGADIYQERTALILIDSAVELDPFASYAVRDEMALKTRLNVREDWQTMRGLLINYLDRQPETEVARSMVRYLLEGMNTREERERVLADMLNLVGDKDKVLASDIATERGILMAEKGDVQGATAMFLTACRLNPFNELAFVKSVEVTNNLTPSFWAVRLRLAMSKNPLDIKGSFSFAAFMEKQGSFIIADRAYEYTSNLYSYLHPQAKMPAEIYLPWSLCCYAQADRADQCLAIAEMVRAGGDFDPVIEGIALKAAENAKMSEKVKEIAARVESKLAQGGSDATIAERAAWYYAFAAKDAGKALSWANKAYAADPNVETTRSLLVYALVMNGQADVAAEMVKESRAIEAGKADQMTMVAMGVKLLDEKKKDEAVTMLKGAVALRPDSVEASEAKQLLAFNGESYTGVDEKNTVDMANELKSSYGENVVPQWMQPEKILSLKLTSRLDDTPSFDSDLKLDLAITNNSTGPVMLGEGSLFGGAIRVDGGLKGDVQKKLPGLVSKTIGRWTPVQPGQSMVIPLNMNINGVYDALQEYPQANLDISFTAYLDPIAEKGRIRNGMAGMEPGTVTIARQGIKPSRELVNNRLDALAKGYHSQKMQAARMFASLLRERIAMDRGLVKYQAVKLDPSLLRSAMIRAISDPDWTVQVQAMASLSGISLDFDLTNAVATGLQSKNWPVRLMGIYLLGTAQDQDFDKVLKWYMEKDKDDKVRRMATVLVEERKEKTAKK
jgi:tetratricopeptide (TPR) repeat protein